jgi:uncharacterized membrane protein YbaN (DUF454 family)
MEWGLQQQILSKILFFLNLSHVDLGLILPFLPGETSFFALFLALFARSESL